MFGSLPSATASPSAAVLPPARTGWASLDAVLGGGWPAGELSELVGHGRSTLGLAAARLAQQAGQPTCWIDGPGTFCPATAGVDLSQLVLVAPGGDGWTSGVVRVAAGARGRRAPPRSASRAPRAAGGRPAAAQPGLRPARAGPRARAAAALGLLPAGAAGARGADGAAAARGRDTRDGLGRRAHAACGTAA